MTVKELLQHRDALERGVESEAKAFERLTGAEVVIRRDHRGCVVSFSYVRADLDSLDRIVDTVDCKPFDDDLTEYNR